MTRTDWLILRRLAGRVALTLVIFAGLVALVELINPWRYTYLMKVGGLPLAAVGLASETANWVMKALPLMILVGTVIGVIDLQSRRELMVVKSTGSSVWRILRLPILAVLVFGLFATTVGETFVTANGRTIRATLPGENAALSAVGGLWLEQSYHGARYILQAQHVVDSGAELQDVSVFFPDGLQQGRITAPSAKLSGGMWQFAQATRYKAGASPEKLLDYALSTATTPADLRLRLTTTDDMTFGELARTFAANVSDRGLRNAVSTRFFRLLSLPALLVGSLFIAFAFTAGYRRTNNYGVPIISAIVVGFVVFVITEMADRAGSAGVLDPTFAACGPAFVALIIGLTVLLYREDGWA